ncbi:bifunctional adenosylcobinamide kinase/adenosylcobinamide-phosphate guanylyltransferase [Ruixingdingia sedimenti]|uniref:Bifunctional adenosylcobalamin biosynthesis protein n=1 Tax=Ruixingdingia sedimenti TaxID=3073604 RepID=A0ABU1F7K6_9RHOB|nr:bifunctional adenosylcobinamide kinase/adenosylcobinamide-phosphate guanylyltransferase [Xinfangfangia sp. LG-4]MDR5652856.1 bifunctional adenosylcobinamide kinase/adenosylcobinamide-phosphate guanylyltransferase [Xinfangfangia sp. LG-4]
MATILITGGVRSGKSLLAETRAAALPGRPVYIATAEPGDAEMAERIAAHRARRGAEWRTVEVPLDLAGALDATDGHGPRLVDCLTLWLSNLMGAGRNWRAEAEALAATLARQQSPVILVTNEVGMGIVPANALARAFRDAAGGLNQRIAAMADEVILTVAGQPLKVKG